MLLHLCQPTKPGWEELGKAKPNGGVTYPRIDEVFFFFFLSLAETQEEAEEALKTLEAAGANCNIK